MKKCTLLNLAITVKSVKNAKTFMLSNLNSRTKVFGRLTKRSDIGM